MPKLKKKSRTKHLLETLNASENGKSKNMRVSDAAHASYIEDRLKDLVPDGRERGRAKYDLSKRRLDGESYKDQADAIAKMKKGGRVKAKKDACYSKVKARYKVWPSAYASGALAKCRKVGASNWGNKVKK